jgi:hypothetical protein
LQHDGIFGDGPHHGDNIDFLIAQLAQRDMRKLPAIVSRFTCPDTTIIGIDRHRRHRRH